MPAEKNVEATVQAARVLRYRLLLYLSMALLCLAVILFLATHTLLIPELRNAEDRDLLYHSTLRAMAIAQWVESTKELARQVTSRTRIRQELEAYNRGEVELSALRAFTEPKLGDALALSDTIRGIARVHHSGRIVSAIGDLSGMDRHILQTFAEAPRQSASVSIPYMRDGECTLMASAPIKSPDGSILGVDLLSIHAQTLLDLIQPLQNKAQSKRIHLIAMEGESYVPIPSALGEDLNEPVRLTPGIRAEFDAHTSGIFYEEGATVSFVHLEGLPWMLLVIADQGHLYQPIRIQIVTLILIFFAVYCLILIGFAFLMRPLAGQMLIKVDVLEEEVRRRVAEEAKVAEELRRALSNIHALKGLLPICGYCKKIRDDEGYWNQVETYIKDHSEAECSHSVCPDCLKVHHPTLYEKYKREGRI